MREGRKEERREGGRGYVREREGGILEGRGINIPDERKATQHIIMANGQNCVMATCASHVHTTSVNPRPQLMHYGTAICKVAMVPSHSPLMCCMCANSLAFGVPSKTWQLWSGSSPAKSPELLLIYPLLSLSFSFSPSHPLTHSVYLRRFTSIPLSLHPSPTSSSSLRSCSSSDASCSLSSLTSPSLTLISSSWL